MTEIMTMATEFFLTHSVAICVVFGILLVLSSVLFLKVMSKRKKKVSESKYDQFCKLPIDTASSWSIDDLYRFRVRYPGLMLI